MRKLFVSVALSSLVLSACADGGGKSAEGVSGATIKRAAVGGNFVDFGGEANSVENYDLEAQAVSIDNPVASDARRDQEIDAIVDKISNGSDPAPAPQHGAAPAVPPSPHGVTGVTGSVAPADAQSPLPPLPENAGNPAADEDAAMAAERARLFPKPRWRRELEDKSHELQQAPAPVPANGH